MRFESYAKSMSSYGKTPGQIRKNMSDEIIENSWYEDIQSRTCYIYDYFTDDESEIAKCKNILHSSDTKKTKIDAKFIVTQYGTLAKDQPEYHLQFRPSQKQPAWFDKIEERYQSEFPIGLYIDIPDDRGIYRRWLICAYEYGNQFIKYSILPCNYRFGWVYEGKFYTMWGVARLRNSYNSGVWAEYTTTTIENQDQMWLPMNEISEKLFYDQRIIVSSLIKEPITWRITKVENFHPFGINKLTLGQIKFNPDTDYYDADSRIWFADGIGCIKDNNTEVTPSMYSRIIYNYSSNVIKHGGSAKNISAKFFANDEEVIIDDIIWEFKLNNEDISEFIDVINKESNSEIQIKINNNGYELIGEQISISVSNSNGDYYSELQLDVRGL